MWDELDTVLLPQSSPWDPAARVLNAARNLGINAVVVSKTPGIVPAGVRAAWDVLLYVAWSEPRYVSWLEAQGLPIDPLPRFSFHAAFWRSGELVARIARNDSFTDIAGLLSAARAG